ncbi:MAG TPA: transporter substrate-binding domain-containing protein [Xanthobacteraceae bacterium]|nr:transporter substrate-binding domain-containing protein [Xanthobacteraceae bacterium]
MVFRARAALVAVLIGCAILSGHADDLVPTGTLRATFIANNPVQAVTDGKTGEVSGPAADLGRELARRLGVPFAIKGVPGVQPVIDSVKDGAADIGFVAFDPVRAAQVDFSQPYSLAQNTYLVRESSPIRSVADVDRPGVRVGVGLNDAGDYFLTRTLKQAQLKRNAGGSLDAALGMLEAGDIDAYAANRQRLTTFVARQPSLRIVPDNFYGVEQAIVVAKGNARLLAEADRLIEEARASGFIAAAIARAGLAGVDVAPPRQPPR